MWSACPVCSTLLCAAPSRFKKESRIRFAGFKNKRVEDTEWGWKVTLSLPRCLPRSGPQDKPFTRGQLRPLLSASVALTGHVGSSTGGRKHVVTGVPWEVTLEHFPFSDPIAFIYVTPCPPPSRNVRSGVELAPREVWAHTGSEQLGGILHQCFLSWSQQICAQGYEFSQN